MDSAPHVSEIPAKFQSNLDPLEDNILAIFMIVIGKHDCDCNYLLLCISYMLRYCLKLKLQSKDNQKILIWEVIVLYVNTSGILQKKAF